MPRTSPAKITQKEKIGTILDREVMKKLRNRSRREGRPISDIIQDAIVRYTEIESTNRDIRIQTAHRFCSRPYNITRRELDDLLGEDYYEQ
jgi:hypothetical protein